MLLESGKLAAIEAVMTISLIIPTSMVDNRLQSRSHASKGNRKVAPEFINGAVKTLPISRYSRIADMRPRLEDLMWSHGG